ncbi:MAG: AAA family ATPase [Actinomycetaceae bacterium]
MKLTKALKKVSGTKVDIPGLVSQVFTQQDDNFFDALTRISYEVERLDEAPFPDVPYDRLFNSNTEKILNDPKFQSVLAEYVTRLNELLDQSTFFSRAKFSYYNAETVSKSLAAQGFFDAKHSLLLAGESTPRQVSSRKELETLILEEKERIAEDPELRSQLSAIEKAITGNQANRDFLAFISDHPELLTHFANITRFKQELWTSYLKECEELYTRAVASFKDSEARRRAIEKQAAAERTRWEEVIDLFNTRFSVPFTLVPRNREKVMLAQESFLTLDFEFKDGGGASHMDREHLLRVLSTGERKAFYILNVLFEVEARKEAEGTTLFVIDDIADSFDYKNKYAIIQYLKDMSEQDKFRLIILTHNFDFLRTIFGRNVVTYGGCFMAEKSVDRVTLTPMAGSIITNPFTKDFKKKIFTDGMRRVASIPFTRNLIEYSRGNKDADYLTLTSLIHLKEGTRTTTQAELDRIFGEVFPGLSGGPWSDGNESVLDMVYAQAEIALTADEGVNFANKIVLSMAIRLRAEEFMVSALDADGFDETITSNQTWHLFNAFKQRGLGSEPTLDSLRRVLLITPENIHINSFMYEPILDMSDHSLRELYSEVKRLFRIEGVDGLARW